MGRHDDSGLGHGTGGSPQGTLEQNEYDNVVDNLANKFPQNDSQIKHIFRPKEGHLSDTPENRKLIETTANDPANYRKRAVKAPCFSCGDEMAQFRPANWSS